MLTFREVYEVEHIGGETEAVAELFNENAQVDGQQRVVLHMTEIDKRETSERHAPCHRPEPLLQSAHCRCETAYDAAGGEADYAHSTVHQAHRFGGETESALVHWVEQKGTYQFYKLRFRQSV